jgi:hypothetical protein
MICDEWKKLGNVTECLRSSSTLFFAKYRHIYTINKFSKNAGLFCGGDFVDDGLGGGAWVGSGGDGTANYEEIGAGFDGFGGSCGAGLVVGSWRGGFEFRSTARFLRASGGIF